MLASKPPPAVWQHLDFAVHRMRSRRRLSHKLTDAFSGVVGTELGAAAALFDGAAGTGHFRRIPLDRIRPREDHARTSLDATALEELTESIRHHGVLQPIRVRSCGAGRYEIVAGERRWAAAQQAGLRTIPAVIAVADDAQAYVESLIENVQREDLNALDRANALRYLRVNLGLRSWEEVGHVVGITRQHVHNLLRIAALPEPMQDDVRAGSLSEKHSRALLALREDPSAQSELWERIHRDVLSGDAAMVAARELRSEVSVTASRRAGRPGGDDMVAADDESDEGLAPPALPLATAVDLLLESLAQADAAEVEMQRSRLEELRLELSAVLGRPAAPLPAPGSVSAEGGQWQPVLVSVVGNQAG
jgi:ParB family chromosome partitioning protein